MINNRHFCSPLFCKNTGTKTFWSTSRSSSNNTWEYYIESYQLHHAVLHLYLWLLFRCWASLRLIHVPERLEQCVQCETVHFTWVMTIKEEWGVSKLQNNFPLIFIRTESYSLQANQSAITKCTCKIYRNYVLVLRSAWFCSWKLLIATGLRNNFILNMSNFSFENAHITKLTRHTNMEGDCALALTFPKKLEIRCLSIVLPSKQFMYWMNFFYIGDDQDASNLSFANWAVIPLWESSKYVN